MSQAGSSGADLFEGLRQDPLESFLALVAVVLLVGTFVSREPRVASWLWHKNDNYGGTAVWASEAARASFLEQPLSRHAMAKAEAIEEQLAFTEDTTARAATMVRGRTFASLALHLLYLPAFLLVGFVSLKLGRLRRRSSGIGLETALVRLDASSGLGRAPIAELPLPWGYEARGRREGLAKAVRAYEEIAPIVAAQGPSSWAVSGALAKLDDDIAQQVRLFLDRDQELTCVRRAWAARPGPGAWGLGRWLAIRRMRSALRGTTAARELERLVLAGVIPDLLEVREELRRIGGLTALRDRALRVAAAHAHYPASIDHHAAHEGGLLEHKVSVLREAIRLVKAGEVADEDLDAFLAATCVHDLGKCRSFRKAGGAFKRLDGLHAQHTARMLRSFPELEAEHGRDTERLLLTLAHEHDRENIPDDYRASCGRLQRLIHRCDASAVSQEATSTLAVENAADRALEALPRMVQELVINGVGGKRFTHGLYEKAGPRGEEVLFLMEAAWRDQLQAFVGTDVQRGLSLWTRRGKGLHPGTSAVMKVMAQAKALPEAVRGIPITAERPLVSMYSGDVPFYALFPVSLAWLSDKLGPDEVDRLRREWASRGFELRGIVSGVTLGDGADEGSSDGQAGSRSGGEDDAPYGWCTACNRKLVVHHGTQFVACPNFFTGNCKVRMPLKDGKPDPSCELCGTDKRIVRPKDQTKKPFLGCPKRCKPPRPGDGGDGKDGGEK